MLKNKSSPGTAHCTPCSRVLGQRMLKNKKGSEFYKNPLMLFSQNPKKRGQQEMVGFILIVILVMIGLMVFLVISVRDPAVSDNDVVVLDMLGAIMRHTTECATVYEPAYDDFEDLFASCYVGDQCTNLGKSACDYLNKSLKEVVDDMIASDASINSYSIDLYDKDDDVIVGIMRISEGNCTGSTRSAQRAVSSRSGMLIVRAKLCY